MANYLEERSATVELVAQIVKDSPNGLNIYKAWLTKVLMESRHAN